MLLLRLSPLIPFNAINYIAGTTKLTLRDYIFAEVGIIPGTILFCYLGATAGSLTNTDDSDDSDVTDDWVRIVVIVAGLLFGIAAVAVTSIYAKKELDKILAESRLLDEAAVEAAKEDENT